MKILFAHNAYQQRGGEDMVVDAEIALLRAKGHLVVGYRRSNDDIVRVRPLGLAVDTFWSRSTVAEVNALINQHRPDIIHTHNTFPLISPSLYWAARRAGIPVVQTLHNFRMICPQAMFLRNGQVCEDCLGHVPWRGVVRGCYRGSRAQSVVLAGMTTSHWLLGTWRNKVTRYIALNDFCRDKFIEGGLLAEKIAVKPNFVDWATAATIQPDSRQGFLFVGRLSPEKGVLTLSQAVTNFGSNFLVRVAGTGAESRYLEGSPNVRLLGALGSDGVRAEMERAQALVMPSIWYENFPRTLVEAFACGLPVIASRLGAMAELIRDGETGLLFEPGNAEDLALKMRWAQTHPQEMVRMGRAARAEYESKYTPEINYQQLMAIYQDAIEEVQRCSR